MKNSLVCLAMVCSLLLTGGCARNISSNSYGSSNVGTVATSLPCTVVSVRKVLVESDDNKVGTLGGAIAGAAIGQAIGGGRGRTIATVAGALAGAAAGNAAQKSMSKQEGLEYTVKTADGTLRTVVQGTDVLLMPGDKATLVIYPNGERSRLIPA